MAETKTTLERVYNIPLRKEVQKAPKYKLAKKAISAIRKFVERHMKSGNIKIGKYLNDSIWEHGIKNVPHHIKVNCSKDEKGVVNVELFGAPKEEAKKALEKKETKETPKEEPKKEEAKIEMVEEKPQHEQKAEIAKEIQKEEIRELQKEKPKLHRPKEEAKPRDLHLRKKEMIPAQSR